MFQLFYIRGIGNLEGFQAGDVFRDFDSQGKRHGIANTVIRFMFSCGAVALGDGLFNVGLVVRDGQSSAGSVNGKACVTHFIRIGNGRVSCRHSLAIFVNVKVEFACGVQDIALVIICGITCFLQIVAAFGKVFQSDFAVSISYQGIGSLYRSIFIFCVTLPVQGKLDVCQLCCFISLFA